MTLKVFLFATFPMVPAPPASYSFQGLSTPKVLPVSTPYSQMLSASTSTCSQPFRRSTVLCTVPWDAEGHGWQCSALSIVTLQLLSSKKEASRRLIRWERCPGKGVTAQRAVTKQKQVGAGHWEKQINLPSLICRTCCKADPSGLLLQEHPCLR